MQDVDACIGTAKMRENLKSWSEQRESRATPRDFFLGIRLMPEGTIKRLTDKGYGFIDTGSGPGTDMFFHSSNVEGTTYDDLTEGQRVSYTEGTGPKGPRAENVTPV